MSTNKRTGQTLARQVPAADSGKLAVGVDRAGTIESLKLRIYRGAENTLRLKPQKKTNGGFENLLDYGDGKAYVDGDDDIWEWSLSEPVTGDDEVVIRYENRDGQNAHNFRATVEIDYKGGLSRAISGVLP